MSQCYTIGLTGGIASGKSAVSDKFSELGAHVIDADIIARDVVKPNTAGLKKLIGTFGNSILNQEKTLDRSKLRKIVFNDKNKLAQINTLLHPLIQQHIMDEVKCVNQSFCIIVIPLLCESSRYDWLDRILVVDVKPETQLKRLLSRDNITENLAHKMMKSQCSQKQRLSLADDVINNEQSLVKLHENVEILNRMYKLL